MILSADLFIIILSEIIQLFNDAAGCFFEYSSFNELCYVENCKFERLGFLGHGDGN